MRPPLADRLRPRTLDEVVGHRRLLGPGRPIRIALEAERLQSMILWGPPGCGKTTLARLFADHVSARFRSLSAVMTGLRDLRALLEEARTAHRFSGEDTLLFIDEIHRWNKAQQDALLPLVESGELLFMGATTENPSFEVIPALRSRARVVPLQPLEVEDVVSLLSRAVSDSERGLESRDLIVEEGVLSRLAGAAGGDARRALGALERLCAGLSDGASVTEELAQERLERGDILYDKSGEEHFNVTSALIKSMRGSDPDAALYWLARMVRGGEEPRFIARRLIIFASEDIGNADPRALTLAVAAAQAVHWVGYPEARINLAQAVTYMACAPKSNASYHGIDSALAEVARTGPLPVPMHLRNAPTRDMKTAGYGAHYKLPHDHPFGVVSQRYLPKTLDDRRFYTPVDWGYEKHIRERLAWWEAKLSERESD